jgi:hypothetical protein
LTIYIYYQRETRKTLRRKGKTYEGKTEKQAREMCGSRVYTNKGKCMSEYTMGEYMSEVHYTTLLSTKDGNK